MQVSTGIQPPWAEVAVTVAVSAVCGGKRRALATYTSIFQQEGERLLSLYEAEDR
ncbi:MAG: hypothetical protein ACXWQZ_11400 [Ktedonobacterales bacterium]